MKSIFKLFFRSKVTKKGFLDIFYKVMILGTQIKDITSLIVFQNWTKFTKIWPKDCFMSWPLHNSYKSISMLKWYGTSKLYMLMLWFFYLNFTNLLGKITIKVKECKTQKLNNILTKIISCTYCEEETSKYWKFRLLVHIKLHFLEKISHILVNFVQYWKSL